jgi:hypothetical protein
MIKIIADTNIWYAIAEKRIEIFALKKKYKSLCVAPLSILEIVKGVTLKNFDLRKKVATAIINHADDVLDELPLHLAKLWGFQTKGYRFNWKKDLLKPFIAALNYSTLVSGFPDLKSGKIKALDMRVMNDLHETIWKQWGNSMIDWADTVCPGYKNARNNRKTKFLKKVNFNNLSKEFHKEKLKDLMTLWTVELTSCAIARNFHVKNDYLKRNKNRIKKEIAPFIDTNIEYSLSCLVDSVPEPNDYVDLMIFLYLQGKMRLMTLERKWIEIAQKKCPSFLIDYEIQP